MQTEWGCFYPAESHSHGIFVCTSGLFSTMLGVGTKIAILKSPLSLSVCSLCLGRMESLQEEQLFPGHTFVTTRNKESLEPSELGLKKCEQI